ncbi:hypothetical protein BV25DRAFT_1829985 [Artomyces pyxidatus]|uniref:Uncharacterized protein n=1 Tax=Artomyces pyxidatus TaxID=48021 RepID=A0ACB8SPN4_9AGAM|nr:hypothetical protein BV25DRAFT_1829985 [Artomyces pyxidatus]
MTPTPPEVPLEHPEIRPLTEEEIVQYQAEHDVDRFAAAWNLSKIHQEERYQRLVEWVKHSKKPNRRYEMFYGFLLTPEEVSNYLNTKGVVELPGVNSFRRLQAHVCHALGLSMTPERLTIGIPWISMRAARSKVLILRVNKQDEYGEDEEEEDVEEEGEKELVEAIQRELNTDAMPAWYYDLLNFTQ